MVSELDLTQATLVTQRLELHHISGANLITLFEDRDDAPILKNANFTNPHRVLVDFQGPLHWRVLWQRESETGSHKCKKAVPL